MVIAFVQWLSDGFVRPRQSLRSLVDADLGLDAALTMVVLGYLVTAILLHFVPGAYPEGQGFAFGLHMLNLFGQVVFFFLMAAMILYFGRISGGAGTWDSVFLAVGWHGLVTSVLAPLTANLMVAIRPEQAADGSLIVPDQQVASSTVLLAMVAIAIWFWLLAHYIAEAHKFPSTWGVLGVLVGIILAVASLFAVVLGGLAA